MKEQIEHNLLLKWLILTGLISFSVIAAWNEGVIFLLYSVDKSHISIAITLIYLLVTIHCALRIYTISSETNLSKKVENIVKNEEKIILKTNGDQLLVNSKIKLPMCLMTEYIRDLCFRNNNISESNDSSLTSDLNDVYNSRLKGPQEIGWFVSDMMLKLGLLGTIIGFIFMLVLTSFNILSNDIILILEYISKFLLTIAMAGIGLKISFNNLLRNGEKIFQVAIAGFIFQIICVFIAVSIL